MTNQAMAVTGTACAVCGATAARIWRVAPDYLLGGDQTFRALRCLSCGLARLQPRPSAEDMGKYYAVGAYARAEGDSESSGLAARLNRTFQEQASRAVRASRRNEGRLLDIGCGDGRFLAAMAAHGWQVEGIEMDGVAAVLARKRTGASVYNKSVEDLNFPEESFDMVSLLHVLEHVPDPRNVITVAFRLLRPGGTLFLALPNAGSPEAAFFGNLWYALDLPRHFWGFTPSTLRRLTKECGFQEMKIRHFPLFYFFQNVRNVIRRLAGKKTAPSNVATDRVEGSGMRTLAFYALLTVSKMLGVLFPGEVMELTARKPMR